MTEEEQAALQEEHRKLRDTLRLERGKVRELRGEVSALHSRCRSQISRLSILTEVSYVAQSLPLEERVRVMAGAIKALDEDDAWWSLREGRPLGLLISEFKQEVKR